MLIASKYDNWSFWPKKEPLYGVKFVPNAEVRYIREEDMNIFTNGISVAMKDSLGGNWYLGPVHVALEVVSGPHPDAA